MIQDDSHSSGSINYETPVSQQSFVGTLLMVVILLGNIALGASANEQFSNHVRDLQINIMKVEKKEYPGNIMRLQHVHFCY